MRQRTMRSFAAAVVLATVVGFIAGNAGADVAEAHVLLRASNVAGPGMSRTVWDSVYSADQATRGEASYLKSCARCHKASLSGADEASPLTGSGFLGNWNGLPLSDLSDR